MISMLLKVKACKKNRCLPIGSVGNKGILSGAIYVYKGCSWVNITFIGSNDIPILCIKYIN
jgi:hypothetical protein